jgi:hypothetical protein
MTSWLWFFLQCDGKDLTGEIESKKLQGVLFLNINSYAGGTNPWGARPGADHRQSFSDMWIEVVGITNVAQLVCTGYCLMHWSRTSIDRYPRRSA